jgi:uncharacterized membrane protein YgdD (TMEM256/DUF423 family)
MSSLRRGIAGRRDGVPQCHKNPAAPPAPPAPPAWSVSQPLPHPEPWSFEDERDLPEPALKPSGRDTDRAARYLLYVLAALFVIIWRAFRWAHLISVPRPPGGEGSIGRTADPAANEAVTCRDVHGRLRRKRHSRIGEASPAHPAPERVGCFRALSRKSRRIHQADHAITPKTRRPARPSLESSLSASVGTVDRLFLVIASLLGFIGVALGAFGSHALRVRLSPDGLWQFDTGVRYQMWHALALFAVVLVRSLRLLPLSRWFPAPLPPTPFQLLPALAAWLFVAGVVLFSGSLYALALTGDRRWAAVTPFGGLAFLLGWLALLLAILTM